jgi:hypothetical protein
MTKNTGNHEGLGKLSVSCFNNLEIRHAKSQDEDEYCPYRSLWSAVITQALTDARSNSKKKELRKYKAEGKAWLFGGSTDFETVCIMAGMNPKYVKNKARNAVNSSIKWRRDAGSGPRYLERKRRDMRKRMSLLSNV